MKKYESLINVFFACAISVIVQVIFDLDVLYLIVIYTVVYPWRYKGNVYSLFGGMNSSGSVISLLGIFQLASKDAKSIFALMLYQKAGRDAAYFCGLSCFQKAKRDTTGVIACSVFQHAEDEAIIYAGFSVVQLAKSDVFLSFGVSLVQTSESGDVYSFLGISAVQCAGGDLMCWSGISLYQHGTNIDCDYGIFLYQKALVNVCNIVTLSFYQHAKYGSLKCQVVISLVQRAGDRISCIVYLCGFQWSEERLYLGFGLSYTRAREITRNLKMSKHVSSLINRRSHGSRTNQS